MEIVKLENVSKHYDGFTAVKDLNFSVTKGEVLSIIGPNGAGKTTTLKMICGLIEPTSGKVSINGMTDAMAIRQMIGYMPEENALYEGMRVKDYLKFFAQLYSVPGKTAERRIAELLAFVNLEDNLISNLSKGMKRKVLIARSLINEPELLVYDEPASGLDPVTARNLLDEITKLKSLGKTIIMSAHDLSQVEQISDRLIIMNKGLVEVTGTIPQIKSKHGKGMYSVKAGRGYRFKTKQEMLDFINRKKAKITDLTAKEKSLQEIFVEKYG